MITIWREKICQEIFLRDIKDIIFRKGVAMEDLFLQAKKAIVGGVNSPVRAFGAVGGTPIFISYARGAKIYDTQGKEYIDYVLSWGPAILGHAYPTREATREETRLSNLRVATMVTPTPFS